MLRIDLIDVIGTFYLSFVIEIALSQRFLTARSGILSRMLLRRIEGPQQPSSTVFSRFKAPPHRLSGFRNNTKGVVKGYSSVKTISKCSRECWYLTSNCVYSWVRRWKHLPVIVHIFETWAGYAGNWRVDWVLSWFVCLWFRVESAGPALLHLVGQRWLDVWSPMPW